MKLVWNIRIDPYGFERSDDFDYESYEELMSEYLVILTRRSIKWSRLLKGKGKVQKNVKCKFVKQTRQDPSKEMHAILCIVLKFLFVVQ